MRDDFWYSTPVITDKDVRSTCLLLGLPENAFHGSAGDDPRSDVLKRMDSFDVAACPGSGKTTLLVAKLAILASKWRHRTRGICVLSHTNAARREIQGRLGNTAIGRQLLAYPHFIGTIHGFMNSYFAMPWLRALGYPVKMIDTNVCVARRWRSLPRNTRQSLEKNRHGPLLLRISSPDCSIGPVRWGKGTLSANAPTYSHILAACKQSIEDGYHCYEEMFVWASDMLDNLPTMVHTIRDRFPLMFVDEAQDNSEAQSAMLHRMFIEGANGAIRQRFGDADQAIYTFVGAKGATMDKFGGGGTVSIPNSHRFGMSIAKVADPLGLVGHDGGLKGNGPRPVCDGSHINEGPHTIFIFSDDAVDKVLPAYSRLLIETFSDDELACGTFTAVGQVHNNTGDDHPPRHVGHYWPDYDSSLSGADPQPATFVQYVSSAHELAQESGETHTGIEKIAQGILRLARMAKNGRAVRPSQRSHRRIMELLDTGSEASNVYHLLVTRVIVKQRPLTKRAWETRWAQRIRDIGEHIAGTSLGGTDVDAFLAWNDATVVAPPARDVRHANVYRYPAGAPQVHISVGSIHSVKGQTHTSTLVLETFWQDRKGRHNLELLLPWLDGTCCGRATASDYQVSRLKVHYVAMTRPTHLLCLAMKRSTFVDKSGELDAALMQKLASRGWRLELLGANSSTVYPAMQ